MILLVDIGAERCGSYRACKTWKVGKFKNFIFRPGKSWKIKALQSNLYTCYIQGECYIQGHWASELKKLFAWQENLLVLEKQMGLFSNPTQDSKVKLKLEGSHY